MDSVVHIRIGNQKKSTSVRYSTDSPYFNEYFVFEFNMPQDKFLDQNLTLTVIQPGKIWRRRKILGFFHIDIATIWAETKHMFFHKWAVLNSDKRIGTSGYVKIDIGILSKGEVPHFPTQVDSKDDEIMGNLLLPQTVSYDRHRTNFIFYIYNGEGIPKIKDSLPSTYVQITFAGLTGKTSIKRNTKNPIWNEKIVITDLFPSLGQRVKIELKYTEHIFGSVIHYLYLKSISDSSEHGFLPTFGPSHIYLYRSVDSYEEYNGKILFEMKTEILSDSVWRSKNVNVTSISSIPNKEDLEAVENIFENSYETDKDIVDTLLLKTINNLNGYCKKYYEIFHMENPPNTSLDKKMYALSFREIQDIEVNSSKIMNIGGRKKTFRTLRKMLHRLFNLKNEVQDCWPDIFLYMYKGNKKIAFYKEAAKNIIFSSVKEKRGDKCGIFKHIYMKPIKISKEKLTSGENSAISCKLVAQMWIGLHSEMENCINMILSCCQIIETNKKFNVPKNLKCEENHNFTLKIYIYEGRFIPGSDETALADIFIAATINENVIKTTPFLQSINPVWNKTLIFENIKLVGSEEFIGANPSEVDIEVFDQDIGIVTENEFIGRCSIIPIKNVDNAIDTVKLRWINVYNGTEKSGEILIAAELISADESAQEPAITIVEDIPSSIKPNLVLYRLDVYFWSVYDLKKSCLFTITKPKITIECRNTIVQSTIIQNSKKYLNFENPYQYAEMYIPDCPEYYPPISIKLYDCRTFGRCIYIGTNLVDLKDFIYTPLSEYNRKQLFTQDVKNTIDIPNSINSSSEDQFVEIEKNTNFAKQTYWATFVNVFFSKKSLKEKIIRKKSKTLNTREKEELDLETIDWWTKFYLSLDEEKDKANDLKRKFLRIKIYKSELESQNEYHNFEDLLKTIKIFRGKRTGDEILDEDNIIAIFKGAIRIYRCLESSEEKFVTETNEPIENGAFQHYPLNTPTPFLIRIYIIRAINLRPKDLSGKSDPYVILKLRNQTINDVENYIPNQVNPVFGRCYEFNGIFPFDNMLVISVWDRDLTTADDFIGETKIDLEKRLYTNHRANCGLSYDYIQQGACAWRDQLKPSQILENLCKKYRINKPEYKEKSVKIGPCIFSSDRAVNTRNSSLQMERLSLMALHRWKEIPLIGCRLVPEHVETRSLYHSYKPGLEQGKLQLWIDIFPSGDNPPPPPVDIKPRQPIRYELRVIIWNTEDVTLDEDDFFIGQQKSDIYVKGWLIGPDESQCTDVHYNSISGEGNFNWRFIFKFSYLPAEDKIVLFRKESILSYDFTEYKIPSRLTLQVWDNDTFNADDFLGSLILNLSKLPRGAKNTTMCDLNMLEESPTINIFRTNRHRGWWPFKKRNSITDEYELTGKVEIELQLLTEQEAEKSPAGLGRSEPQSLPNPKRPDISFFWLTSPLKTLNYAFKRFRKQIIFAVLLLFVGILIFVWMKNIPSYIIKLIRG